jgi:hypothetical protein
MNEVRIAEPPSWSDPRRQGTKTPDNVAEMLSVGTADVPVIDGVNHPADHGRGYEIVGHLHFIPNPKSPRIQ